MRGRQQTGGRALQFPAGLPQRRRLFSEDLFQPLPCRQQRHELLQQAVAACVCLRRGHPQRQPGCADAVRDLPRCLLVKPRLNDPRAAAYQRRVEVFRAARSDHHDRGQFPQRVNCRWPRRHARAPEVVSGHDDRRHLRWLKQPHVPGQQTDVLQRFHPANH